MKGFSSRILRGSFVSAVGLSALVVACDSEDLIINNVVPVAGGYLQTNLVADVAGGAPTVDPLLVNPWGLAVGPNTNLWVANAGSGTSTSYDVNGLKLPGSVAIPSATGGAGSPTGIVFNPTTSFTIPNVGVAQYIFAGEDGTIAAWDGVSASAQIVGDRSATGAVYKGLTMATNAGVNFLYATDFHNNRVDVFDGNFALVNSFGDATVPVGYAPFGIQNIGGSLYVTFAKQLLPDAKDDEKGAGNGFVDVFNPDGTVARRFVSNGSLNSPWGVALAPANFGAFSGAILIGNFGDGRIGAYNAVDGAFLGNVSDANGAAIAIDGLWALTFGQGTSSATLFFTAGPANETHGLLGSLTPR
jgi:uncharacterized protein (TIGR03118 family)